MWKQTVQIYETHDLLGPLFDEHIWSISHLASHLSPRVTCWDFHIRLTLTDISYTMNRVHTHPSHKHSGNHPEDWLPSITSGIVRPSPSGSRKRTSHACRETLRIWHSHWAQNWVMVPQPIKNKTRKCLNMSINLNTHNNIYNQQCFAR